MHGPQFIKQQNLRACADYAQKVGQPLVLSAQDREVFPPANPPLPFLLTDPVGWKCEGLIALDTRGRSGQRNTIGWVEFTEVLAQFPEHGWAILNKVDREDCFVVGRYARVVQ